MTQPRPSAAGALNDVALQVTPANVLQVRAAILTEAERLQDSINNERSNVRVGECGGDPVSKEAAVAFNERITDLITQCDAYVAELFNSGAALADIARSYGTTEEQIAASFRGPVTQSDQPVSPSRAGR